MYEISIYFFFIHSSPEEVETRRKIFKRVKKCSAREELKRLMLLSFNSLPSASLDSHRNLVPSNVI